MRNTRKTVLAPLMERTLKALKGQLSPRTLENYRSSISEVKKFEGDRWERLGVGDIDRRWSDRYALWLAKRHADAPQTADFYLRNFRAAYGHVLAHLRKGADGKLRGLPLPWLPSRQAGPAEGGGAAAALAEAARAAVGTAARGAGHPAVYALRPGDGVQRCV